MSNVEVAVHFEHLQNWSAIRAVVSRPRLSPSTTFEAQDNFKYRKSFLLFCQASITSVNSSAVTVRSAINVARRGFVDVESDEHFVRVGPLRKRPIRFKTTFDEQFQNIFQLVSTSDFTVEVVFASNATSLAWYVKVSCGWLP